MCYLRPSLQTILLPMSMCAILWPGFVPFGLYVSFLLLTPRYSADCQQVHWPEHKLTCRSLESGLWHTVKFTGIPPECKDGTVFFEHDGIHFKGRSDIPYNLSKEPLPNIHSHKLFLITLRPGTAATGQDVIIAFDRHYSLIAHIAPEGQAEAYKDIAREVYSRRNDVYMCRWAKRVGEWELSICIDRKPSDDVSW